MSIMTTLLIGICGLTFVLICAYCISQAWETHRNATATDPETQDDFTASIIRWSDVQERKGK